MQKNKSLEDKNKQSKKLSCNSFGSEIQKLHKGYHNIGIITFQRTNNFGGALQCYALYKILSQTGNNVEVVDYKNPNIDNRYAIIPRIRKNIFKWVKELVRNYSKRRNIRERQKKFLILYDKIKYSEKYTSKRILKSGLPYDVIFAGSDQIWNSVITFGMDRVYLLDFPGNFKRCSYAVSLGNLQNEDLKTDYFYKAINSFNKLSVREKNACIFLQKMTSQEVVNCLDPTLLLDVKSWNNLANDSYSDQKNKYIFLYYLYYDKELIKIAKYLSDKLGIAEIICFSDIPTSDDVKWVCNAGPQDFLDIIKNARCIVTSSFHASVFSVIFEKELYTIPHPNTGDRIISLSQICGFEHRVFKNFNDFSAKIDIQEKISYNKDQLNNEVQKSKNYINECLLI